MKKSIENFRIKNKLKGLLFFFFVGLVLTGCLKDIQPADSITTEVLTSSTEGFEDAVNGAYSLFKDHISFNGTTDNNNMYLRQYFQLSSFAGDNVVCGQVTEDPLFLSFSYDHTPTQANARYFWYISYKIINDCNTVIEASASVDEEGSEETDQLIGECYFLRSFVTFNLVRLFSKPYTIDSTGLGVILRTSLDESGQKERATVAETYAQVIEDAKKSASLMNGFRGVTFASQEAAWALLSRVYLYMEKNEQAIAYANKVIESGKFSLTDADEFEKMFANAQGSPGTIWCIGFTDKEDYGKEGSLASMIYSDGNSGWGEEYVSSSLRDLMDEHPEDVRWSYIEPLYDDNENVVLKNGIPMYYDRKFSFQDGSPTLSSPIMFRMAEMYLNRAEAYAKLSNTKAALDDVDEVRKNRGLEAALFNGTKPSNKSLLEVVLEERRNEFSFEGFRMFDLFRNKMQLKRDYWGYHLAGLRTPDIDLSETPEGYPDLVIEPDDNRVQYFIPIDEVEANLLCEQNP